MFSSEERLAKRTPVDGVGRFEYLKQLVNEFATTKVISHKEQVLANLANFAYDPINYQFLRSLGVLNLFLDQLTEDNVSLVRFAVCGLCNLCSDPENKEYIAKIGGIEAIANCVKISDEQAKLSAITALIFLHGCGNTRKRTEDIVPLVRSDSDIRLFREGEVDLASFTSLALHNIYGMFVRFGDLHVIRAVEPGLRLEYKELDCSPFENRATKIVATLYEHCINKRNWNLGSQSQWANNKLLIEYQEADKVNLII